jgi:hypothetical protein|tara:strand:- start:417 stop:620 length:204 start_codon:yes stop_codon:yes gene_type:complete
MYDINQPDKNHNIEMKKFINVISIIGIITLLLFIILGTSCSSSRGYYEQGPDGKIHKVRQPQCVENW